MDNITVDVGRTDVRRGDEAVLIGTQGDERVTAEELARILGTINYEVTCGISPACRAWPRRPAEPVLTDPVSRSSTRRRSALRRSALSGERSMARRRAGARRIPRPAGRGRGHRRRGRGRAGRTSFRRRPARTCSRSRSGSAHGGRSRGIVLAGRHHAAARRRIEADLALRDFTVNAMARPSRRSARCWTRMAGRRTWRRVSCAP